MAPFMRGFLWTEKRMVTEDIFLTTNTKSMLDSGNAIISRATVNKNVKNLKCVTLVNSITTGSTAEEKSCTKMGQLLQVFT